MTYVYRRIGNEFLVNTTTLGQQQSSAITSLASGGFVVTWVDGISDKEIRAQLYDASGASVGSEFPVNTVTGNGQDMPGVTALAAGGFLICWRDAVSNGIKAQLFDAAGTKVGSEFLVNSSGGGQFPDAVQLASGNILVTWNTSGVDPDVKGQLFTAGGAKIGGEIAVNNTTASSQFDPSVTTLPSGGFVITWIDASGQSADPNGAVRAQLFDAAGAKVGTELLVNTTFIDASNAPEVASLTSGGFVIVWGDYPGNAWAQIFDAAGSKVGGEINLETDAGDQFYPGVAGLPSGGFAVTWSEYGNDDSSPASFGIIVQVFDAAGARLGADMVVNQVTAGDQEEPVITTLQSGDLVISWTDFSGTGSDTSSSGVKAQILRPLLEGTAGDDILTGTGVGEWIDGLAGNDTLHGLGGNDTLDGGLGNDTVNGGDGDDTAYVAGGSTSANTDTEVVDLGSVNGIQGDEYGTDHLIVDYGSMTQDVIFMGPHQDDVGPSFGSTGAGGRVKIDGAQRLTFDGIGKLTATTGSGNDKVYGVSTVDTISSGSGNDTIYDFFFFMGNRSRIDGGLGVDVAYSVNWVDLTEAVVLDLNDPGGVTIGTGDSQRYLRGLESLYGFTSGSGNDVITLNSDASLMNVISTGQGNDTVTVFGGATAAATGHTVIDLGSGTNDLLILDFSAATQAVAFLDQGAGASVSIGGGPVGHSYSNYERVTLTTGSTDDVVDGRSGVYNTRYVFSTGGGADQLYGGYGIDHLDGGEGNDTLYPGQGSDTVNGGGGNDTIIVRDPLEPGEIFDGGTGFDILELRPISFPGTSYYYFQYVTMLGIERFDFASTPTKNIYVSLAFAKAASMGLTDLVGGAGGDQLSLNDIATAGTYTVPLFNLTNWQNSSSPMDASRDFVGLSAFGPGNFVLNANESLASAQQLSAYNGTDTLNGHQGTDSLYGFGGNDTLDGKGGNDLLDGGSGADQMSGGTGDDIFVVDSAGDVVLENSGEGLDTVRTALGSTSGGASGVYALPDNVEAFVATGNAQGVWGNALDNVITGTTGADLFVLADRTYPHAGANQGRDQINASGGDDYLFFGGSFDALDGITGGSGTDVIALLGNYPSLVLGASAWSGIERLAMYSSGNAADPYSYNVTTHDNNVAAGQALFIGAGSLQANEHLTFNGSAETNGSFTVFAGNDSDTVTGGAKADRLIGRGGADQLAGGLGNDVFQYNAIAESNAVSRDTILDFTLGDRIDLWYVDANSTTGANDAFSFIGNAAFTGAGAASAGQLRFQNVSGTTWEVQGDTDGNGITDFSLHVIVTDAHPLTAGDFIL